MTEEMKIIVIGVCVLLTLPWTIHRCQSKKKEIMKELEGGQFNTFGNDGRDPNEKLELTKTKMKVELEEWQVKALRNYFGLNDKTSLEHWAYDVFNKALSTT